MSFNNKIINKKNKGLTLVEALIVLAVFAGVVAIALNLYNTVTRNSQVSEETTNVSSMFQSIDNFFRRGTTAGLNNETAILAGLVPGGMSIDADTIFTSFNGQVQIAGIPAADNKAFTVAYTRVPAVACSSFILNQVRIGWDKVDVVGDESATAFMANASAGLFFRSANGDGAAPRGQLTLEEIPIVRLCEFDTDYVSIIFQKDSSL